METLLCNKLQFHTFAEHQGWLLLFDKMTEDKSEVGYLLQSGSVIFTVFDIEGNFDRMNDTANTFISINGEENNDD